MDVVMTDIPGLSSCAMPNALDKKEGGWVRGGGQAEGVAIIANSNPRGQEKTIAGCLHSLVGRKGRLPTGKGPGQRESKLGSGEPSWWEKRD